jgi:hypothetical protein
MSWYNPFTWTSSDSTQETESEEEEQDEYPKEHIEDAHVATTFTRTHATIHYKDGSEERVEYDHREDNERTIKIARHDHEEDFRATSTLRWSRHSEPRVYAKATGATEAHQTLNLDSVKKIEVRYVDNFVAFADVEKKVEERKDRRGRVEKKARLHTDQEDVEWSYMIKYEYEAMREREEENE